jgi:hypothetical protein
MCSITELGFVRVPAQAPSVDSLFSTDTPRCSGRRSEAPPSVLRFGGARQPYLEPGFAETANLPVHYEFACTQGCLKRLIEKIGGRLTRSAFPPRFILGQN